jgi:hypothetical protein
LIAPGGFPHNPPTDPAAAADVAAIPPNRGFDSMKSFARLLIVAVLALGAITLVRQTPLMAQGEQPAPKNLKVLPKDMPRREVVQIMRGFSQALGVRCNECHTSKVPGSDRLEDLDFAADDKPEKEIARKMMRMVNSINEQIGQMEFKDSPQVRCVTCHHGVKEPATLAAVMKKSVEQKGVDGAVQKYRDLRKEYYGAAAYDFTSGALNEVAGDLAESKKDYDGALKLLKLNLEFDPRDADSYATMGRVQMAKGDKAAAITSLEKALEIDPDHRWAKMQLSQAKGGK